MFMYGEAKCVHIPYWTQNEDGKEQLRYATMKFKVVTGTADRRKIKKAIRWWVRTQLGRSIHPNELHQLMKRVHSIDPY